MARKLKRIPLDIIPGTSQQNIDAVTALSAVRCVSTDKVYFKRVDGVTHVRPLKSWSIFVGENDVDSDVVTSVELNDMVGVPRLQAWHTVGGTDYLITGTTRKLYATTASGATDDITPLRTASDSIANGIATTNLSSDITVSFASHGLSVGDYVRISGAADTNGILAAQINTTFQVKTVPTSGTFTVQTAGSASSTGSGGGGAGAVMYRQVAYSATRVWSFDNFGSVLVLCPGEDGAIYEWAGSTSTLPTAVSNAPTADWVFVSNNAVVALGAAGQANRIHASGIGDRTQWTAGAGSTAWSDDVEGVSALITQARSRDTNLIFSNHEVLALRYVGLPSLWEWDYVMTSDGINSAAARASIDDIVYWQGNGGVPYWFDGSSAAVIPGNTMIEGMLDIGRQDTTAFVRPMPEQRQVWFYNQAGPVGTYVIFDYEEGHWTFGSHKATCAENPARRMETTGNPVFAYGTGQADVARVYVVDGGGDYSLDESGGVAFTLQTAYMSLDENRRAEILEFMMDVANDAGETFSVTIYTADNPVNEGSGTGAGGMTTSSYTFDPDGSDGLMLVDAVGRYWSVALGKASGTDTNWVIGKITQGVQPGSPL